ncbi:hypothetical protein ACH414_18140 [Streptomyces sp. NPDC020422]|uniref:hypothetical protein n=1 Tax=Streptomyces sp. NPDC020422 TaxID=3365074 RepID=UPI0037ACF576
MSAHPWNPEETEIAPHHSPTFQAGPPGLVDPHSDHLLSSRRGCRRELPQSAVDALTGRRSEEFPQVAALAAARGTGVVNGGHAHACVPMERLPAVLPGTARQGSREPTRTVARRRADDPRAGIHGSPPGSAPRARLVLDRHGPPVRRIAGLDARRLAATAVEALYGQALPMAQRPLRPAGNALLDRAFPGLLDRSVRPAGSPAEPAPDRPFGEDR